METVGCKFPLATMPLGTGNDLSRTLGWGHGLTGSMRRPQWLARVAEAHIVGLDRWCVHGMAYAWSVHGVCMVCYMVCASYVHRGTGPLVPRHPARQRGGGEGYGARARARSS